VERVQWSTIGTLADGSGDLSAAEEVPSITAGSSLRELCHDLIEPAATIRWLVRAAKAESGEELHNRLEAIAAAAAQIAAICDDILNPPRCGPHVRLDKVVAEAAASARTRYAGVIDVVSQPVTAQVRTGDIIRILANILANACRAAGPDGRIIVKVDEADGQARLTVADSGHGPASAAVGGRAGLGLEIVGALTRKYGGSVHLDSSGLGGLAVTVQVPAHGRSSH
jgi:signal transduction histidine kinase